MSRREMFEQLRKFTPSELREVIAEAQSIIDAATKTPVANTSVDPLLAIVGSLPMVPMMPGEIDRTLYGPMAQ